MEESEGGESLMPHLSLTWTFGSGADARGGTQKSPEWHHIESLLERLRDRSGSVTLSIIDAPESGPQLLQVFADNGQYLISLGEIVDGDYDVRSYSNDSSRIERIEILGNLWDGKLVCSDFSVVQQVFTQFFRDGDVSVNLLC